MDPINGDIRDVRASGGSDEALLQLARMGDRDAASELLLRHAQAVRDKIDINPRWRSVLDADEIMQITYLEAFHEIAQFRSNARAFVGWLTRIAQNNLRDAIEWLEREKRPQPQYRIHAPPEEDSIAWLCELITGDTTPSGRLALSETRTLLEEEIATLPADYATVLKALYLEEQTVDHIALVMNRSRGAIYLLRLRAIERLRQSIGSGSRWW